MTDTTGRRMLWATDGAWTGALASALDRNRVAPEIVAAMALMFALVGFAAFGLSGLSEGAARVVWLGLAVIAIQLRLVSGALDARMAADSDRAGPMHPLWADLPVRLSDVLLLVGAGYAAIAVDEHLGPALGWLCAVLALLSAYMRELGARLGQATEAIGPLFSGRRLALLTGVALISMLEGWWGWRGDTLVWGLALIAALTALTLVNRVRRIARRLRDAR